MNLKLAARGGVLECAREWRVAARLSAGVLFVAGGALSGCSVQPSSEGGVSFVAHCGDDAGNLTCELLRRGKPYCDLCRPASNDQGCAEDPPSVPACRVGTNPTTSFPSGDDDDSSTGDAATSMVTLDSESMSGTQGGSSTSSGGTQIGCESPDGALDTDCQDRDSARPYCVAQSCVACDAAGGDAFCGARDLMAPACSAETGTCAGCSLVTEFACGPSTPICVGTGECLECTAHDQCPQGACHLDPGDPRAGECFGAEEVIFVDGGAICPGEGTEVSPNCSIAAALATVSEGDRRVLRIAGGVTYDENLELNVDATVALVGNGGVPTVAGTLASGAGLRVTAGRVYIFGLRFVDNTRGSGLECSNASVRVQASAIGSNDGYGIYTQGPCEIVVERSNIFGNAGGGVRMLGGELTLDNTAVGVNGNGQRGPGLNLQFANINVLYSTIVGNDGVGFDSMQCLDVTGEVRNSVVVGDSTGSVALDCFSLSFANNAIDTGSFAGNGGVLVDDNYTGAWFNNPNDGDFRLGAPPLTPFGDVALWATEDPLLDADGTPRPLERQLGYAGVDEPG